MPRKGSRAVGITLSAEQRSTLREARLLLGLTCEVVAAKAGLLSHVGIVRYEAGTSRPSAEVLEKWAGCVGYEVVWAGLELRPKTKGRKR